MSAVIATFLNLIELSDDFFIYTFLLIVVVYLAIDWVVQRFKKSKDLNAFSLFARYERNNLENYTFNFLPKKKEMTLEASERKAPIFQKIVLLSMALIIVFVPFMSLLKRSNP